MSNINRLTHPMGSSEAKARDLVLQRIEDSIATYGGQNELFRTLNRYFHSLSPSRFRRSQNDIVIRRKGREDIFVPLSFGLVISAVPHWLFNLFGRKPHQKLLGRNSASHDRAGAAEKVLDYDMDRAEVFMNSIPIALSNYKYGTGIGKVGYRYAARTKTERYKMKAATGFNPLTGRVVWSDKIVTDKQPIVEFDGPIIDWVSAYQWHPDPLYWRLDDMRYQGETRWTDLDALKEVNRQHKELTGGEAYYKHLDRIPKLGRAQIRPGLSTDAMDYTAEAMGWNLSPRWKSRWKTRPEDELDSDNVVMIREYWENDRQIELANDEIVIHDGENPYDDKKPPYVKTVCFPIEGAPWGKGYLHVAKRGQEEINSWRNLTLRQARFNVHNIWGAPEGASIDIDEFEPNKIYQMPFHAGGRPMVVPLMEGKPLPPEARYMEGMIAADLQRALGAPDWESFGVEGGAGTATESRLQAQSASMKLRLQGAIGEQSFLVQLAKKFLSRRRQFGADKTVFRIAGKEGFEFLEMSKEDLEGEFDIEPMSGIWHPNLDVLRQQFAQNLAIVGQNPVFMQIHDVYEMWEELWKMFPMLKAPERFLVPPPQKTWDPDKENILMDAGVEVIVTPNEPHPQHYQTHMQGMVQAAAKGNDRAISVYAKHLELHRRLMKPPATPPQEVPGGVRAEGIPNLERATETEAGIRSRIEGGVGV